MLLFQNKDLTVSYGRHTCYLCDSMRLCLIFDLLETDYIDLAVCLICLEELWENLP